jgi:hypothetical protein
VRVVDQQHQDEIIKAQNFQVSDRADRATAVRLGRILGVRKMVFGRLSRLGTSFSLNLLLVDVETAAQEGTRETRCANCELGDLQAFVSYTLANGVAVAPNGPPDPLISIDGLVADVSADGTVIINVGSRGGLKVGAMLQVKRKDRDIRDPQTGKVIRKIETLLGTLKITGVEELSAVGIFAGATIPKVGDSVSAQ